MHTVLQLSDLLSERNQLRAIVESRNSSVQLEKAELERQLEATKQELFSDQRVHREKVSGLETRIEELSSQLSQATTEKETKALELDSFRAKNYKLEQSIRELDKSKMAAIMVCLRMGSSGLLCIVCQVVVQVERRGWSHGIESLATFYLPITCTKPAARSYTVH